MSPSSAIGVAHGDLLPTAFGQLLGHTIAGQKFTILGTFGSLRFSTTP
jgi:hypothetical protein